MSIRAYIFDENEVDSDKEGFKKYEVYQETEPLFNLWKTTHILDLFRYFGFDGTNEDCVGELEIMDEQLEEFLENKKENTKNWSDYDLETLEKIINYFKDGYWILRLRCY